MRPPWLGGGSDSDDSSSDDEPEVTSGSGSVEKTTKILADLSLDDERLHKRVISHQEDEKAIQRLLSLTKERMALTAKYEAQRKALTKDFEKADAAIAEKELKVLEAGGDAAKLEALKSERKDAFQTFSGQEGQLSQEESGTTLHVATEVEKVADKSSMRDESDPDTVKTLMAWLKELKDEKKLSADNSQSRTSTVLKIVELREKAVEEYLASKSKDKWNETQKIIQQLEKEQADKDEALRKKLAEELDKRQKDEEERQKQRQEAVRQLQKEQTKRTKGKSKNKK